MEGPAKVADSKLCNLSEAIDRYVANGSQVAMGTAQETLIPFAAGHEIIRQVKSDLTLIGPISDMLFDQLVGAGCVRKIRAAWIGNVITGSGYNFRRAAGNGAIGIEDHSVLTLTMALSAGAMGVPFMPTSTALGSDLYTTNTGLKTVVCPFSGKTLTAVAAINPDVTIIHAQRADRFGNAHVWGNLGVTREACLDFIPEATVGDYVIIHVGFAITLLSEEEAMETLQLLREISDIEEELGVEQPEDVES
jgi:glutaconate CoA-transferase subunit A